MQYGPKVFNDRPHPGPLPRERVDRSPSHSKTCGWICRTLFRESRSAQWLSPLPGGPGGEGQGEGERYI